MWAAPIVLYSTGTVCCLWILGKEILNRKRWEDNEENNGKPLFTSKWLSIFSLLTMIFCFLTASFPVLGGIPYLCAFSQELTAMTNTTAYACFNYYNLARLHYCFSKSKTYSSKGYPNYLFYFMFAIGFLLWIYVLAIIWIFSDKKCSLKGIPYLAVSIILFLIWTWFTLFLYIYKMRQFHKMISINCDNDKNKEIVVKRIKFVLQKICVLTLICNVLMTTMVITDLIGNELDWPRFMRILSPISFLICLNGVCIVVYLMMEHNIKTYINLLKFLKRRRICFCMLKNAEPYLEAKVEKRDNIDASKYDTKTLQNVDKIEMEHESEFTKTYV